MRRFFEPAAAPAWLKQTLSSIRQALGDIWDVPVRLWQVATASLPTAADFKSGLVYDETLPALKYSDGTSWIRLSDYDADVAAIAALSTTGLIARTGSGTVATRTITGTANQVSVANGDGVAGNPTLSLPAVLVAPGTAEVGTGEDRFDPTMAATFRSSMSVSGGSSTNHANIFNLTATAATAVGNVALIGVVDHAHAAGTITSTSMSVEGFTIHSGAGNSSSLRGVSGNVLVSGSGTVTAATSVFAAAPHKGGGSGTITTAYGLRVASITEGGTNWAVFTEGTTPSSFGGAVTVTGALTALDSLLVVDANFSLGFVASKPVIKFDTGDFIDYNRSTDTWRLLIGGTGVFTATSAGLSLTAPLAVASGGTGGGSASGTLLDNITGFASTGHMVRTAAGTYAFRTITGTTNQITVANGDGVAGAPTLSLPSAIVAPGSLDVTNCLRAIGTSTPSAGAGIEIVYTGTEGRLNAFDRGAAAWKPFLLRGSSVELVVSGTTVVNVTSTSVALTQPVKLPSYAVASLPASDDACLAYASDGRKTGEGVGAGTGVPVYRDGGTWFRFADDAAVAA